MAPREPQPPVESDGSYDDLAIDTASGRRIFRARVSTSNDPAAIWKPLAGVLSVNALVLIGCLSWGNSKLWDLQTQISEQNSIRVQELSALKLQYAQQTGELNTQMARMTAELANLSRQIREQDQ
jgi:hypothetical protein